jgi:hypothetical protein
MTNWTERLLEAIDRLTSHGDSPNGPGHRLILTVDVDELERLAAEARAALAQPEPQGPTDKELLGYMLKAAASVPGGQCTGILDWDKEAIAAARAVLARWGTPANTTNQEDYE